MRSFIKLASCDLLWGDNCSSSEYLLIYLLIYLNIFIEDENIISHWQFCIICALFYYTQV